MIRKTRRERSNCFKVFSFTGSNLLGVIKYGTEIPVAPATAVFPEDLAEELLRIDVAGLSAPVVLPSSGLAAVKARGAVHIVLLPFAFIAQDLRGREVHIFLNPNAFKMRKRKQAFWRADLISLSQLGKLFLRLFVGFVGVRMVLFGHLRDKHGTSLDTWERSAA